MTLPSEKNSAKNTAKRTAYREPAQQQRYVTALLAKFGERFTPGSFPLLIVLVGFSIASAFLWNNGFSIAMADGIAYITGGLNLVNTGQFINPYGEYETWFPPLYPVLIGIFSFGERLDPVAVARLICTACSLWGLVLVWQATLLGTSGRRLAAWFATLVLAGNAMYQTYAMAVMSHAASTACGLAAFVVWLRMEKTATTRQLMALGSFIGAGFLIRPEMLLTFPVWMLIDCGIQSLREVSRRALISGLACAVFVVPYAVYLHQVTGRWQLSAKGEVTVAIGRSIFYGGPRERIDPDTLELKYNTFSTTPTTELQRYGFNFVVMGKVVLQTLRSPLGLSLLLAGLLGAWRLINERRWRFLWGLLAQGVFLFAVAATWCEDRMLHAIWPPLAILAGIGIEQLVRTILRLRPTRTIDADTASAEYQANEPRRSSSLAIRGLSFILLAWVGLAWAEGATRMPRWSFDEGVGPKSILREAGMAFREQTSGQPRGAMYELGATVGYYAGKYRRPLPASEDLDLIVRYAQQRDTPHRPAWLVLWTGEADAYHATIKEPFLADRLPLKKVFERRERDNRVSIYEIPAASKADSAGLK